jgi:predicted GNAT family acetyltransferase
MKLVTPLDRNSLFGIPMALEEGKFSLGGPYELIELLQEPEQYGDEEIDWRLVQITDADGVSLRSAQIDIAAKFCSMAPGAWPGDRTRVSQKLRYIYRKTPDSAIDGVVTLTVSYLLHGIYSKFSVGSEKIITNVYVKAASRGRGIARILLAEVLGDIPDVKVYPQFSKDGARLFGFDGHGKRAGFGKMLAHPPPNGGPE